MLHICEHGKFENLHTCMRGENSIDTKEKRTSVEWGENETCCNKKC